MFLVTRSAAFSAAIALGFLSAPTNAQTTMSFEEFLGSDSLPISTFYSGVTFTGSATGSEWVARDATTNLYNVSSWDCGNNTDSGLSWLGGDYWICDLVGVTTALDSTGDDGEIRFDNADATFVETGYCSSTPLSLIAYNAADVQIASDTQPANLRFINGNANGPGLLRVDAPPGEFISYVIVTDSGNFWVVDNVSTDATGISLGDSCDACDLGSVVTIDDDDEMVVYGTIQMAANAAANDTSIHTVVVCDGYYPENVVVRGVHDVEFIACGDVFIEGMILVKLSTGLSFSDFNVLANGSYAIWLVGGAYGNSDVEFHDCSLSGASSAGMRAGPGNEGITVEGCTISQCHVGVARSYGEGAAASSYSFSGCTITDNFIGATFWPHMNVVLEDNEFSNNTKYGLLRPREGGSGSPLTMTLLDNAFFDNGGHIFPGTSDQDIYNYDQMIDLSDSQNPYTP